MKCADCIHCDICKYRYRPLPLSDSTYDESDHIERIGCPFIDKSLFVELPCNNNDTVYVVYDDGRISKEEVNHFTIYEDGIGITTDRLCDGTWGEDIFPTREEAKKHLKG